MYTLYYSHSTAQASKIVHFKKILCISILHQLFFLITWTFPFSNNKIQLKNKRKTKKIKTNKQTNDKGGGVLFGGNCILPFIFGLKVF